MKGIIEYAGKRVHYYICNKCKAEVPSLMCRIIDLSKPDTPENWMEICDQCYEEEVKENDDENS